VKFIDRFKAMNFANDTEMEQQLQRVREELLSRTAEEYRNSSFAQRFLLNFDCCWAYNFVLQSKASQFFFSDVFKDHVQNTRFKPKFQKLTSTIAIKFAMNKLILNVSI
jgi:hypothetical protein